MRLTTRIAQLEARHPQDENYPRLLIVLVHPDGTWRVGGEVVDPATIDPRTQVIRIGQRPDGPQ
jgi:hypothetical protein